MKKTWKKTLSVFLTLSMVTALVPATAWADDNTEGQSTQENNIDADLEGLKSDEPETPAEGTDIVNKDAGDDETPAKGTGDAGDEDTDKPDNKDADNESNKEDEDNNDDVQAPAELENNVPMMMALRAVAKPVNGQYDSIKEAIEAGVTEITLSDNLTETVVFNENEQKTYILDLGGNTLKGTVRLDGATLTVKNGTIESNQPIVVYGSQNDTENYSVLTVDKTVTLNGLYGIIVSGYNDGSYGYGNKLGYGTVVNVAGNIDGMIFVMGNLGNSEDSASAMASSDNAPVININDGATISGGTNPGVALNGYAVMNVKDGASISGSEAIGVKRGKLNIAGGTFTATGKGNNPVEANNSGTEPSGAAISVTGTYNYAGAISVNITGGTFTSENQAAVYVGRSSKNNQPLPFEKGLDVKIEGGDFTGKEEYGAVFIAPKVDGDADTYTQKVVSGGTFNVVPAAEFVADSMARVLQDDNTYTVMAQSEVNSKGLTQNEEGIYYANDDAQALDSAAKIVKDGKTTYYKTLAAAVAAAEAGDTITLLNDITLEAGPANNIVLNQEITIEGNGKTITRTFDATDNNYEAAFQIMASGVTINNVNVEGAGEAGKDDAAFYIGANGPITIEGCTFDGSGMNNKPASGIISAYGTADKLTVKDCEIKNAKYGMYFNGISNATIEGNTIDTTQYNGIYIAKDTTDAKNENIDIKDNTLTNIATQTGVDEKYLTGIYIEGDSSATLQNNEISTKNDTPTIGGDNIVKATGLALNPTKLSLKVGKTAKLTATVEPADATDKTVTWTSNDTSIAKVSADGTVTAVARGTATITATVQTADGEKTATCAVTVTKKKSSSSSSSSSEKTYTVSKADVENGKVKVDPTKAEKGDKVTITVTPDKGYEINKVRVTDADGNKIDLKDKGNGEYTFTMPASKVEVKATFTKAEEKPVEPEDKTIVLTINQLAVSIFGETKINDVAPIIRNDRTMLPIRVVAEALGATVTWNDSLKQVTITKDDLTIEIFIGSPFAKVNGNPVQLDSPAFIENSRTYLPIRFVAENLGADVAWDQATQQVTITPGK